MVESGMAPPAPEGKVPILESVRAGYAFARASWRTYAPAAVLTAALFALTETFGTTHDRPNALDLVFSMGSFAASLALSAFLFRLAQRQDASGFYGLKFGKDELNLLGAMIVVGFFFLIVLVVGVVVLSVALAVAAPAAGVDLETLGADPAAAQAGLVAIFTGPSGWLAWLVMGALLALFFWLAARLALSSAATVGEGKIMAFSTWDWTRGNAFRILATLFASAFPIGLVIGFVTGFIGAALGVGTSPEGMTGPIASRAVVQFLSALGQFLVLTPVLAGVTSHLYNGLRPPELAAPQHQP